MQVQWWVGGKRLTTVGLVEEPQCARRSRFGPLPRLHVVLPATLLPLVELPVELVKKNANATAQVRGFLFKRCTGVGSRPEWGVHLGLVLSRRRFGAVLGGFFCHVGVHQGIFEIVASIGFVRGQRILLFRLAVLIEDAVQTDISISVDFGWLRLFWLEVLRMGLHLR